MNPFWVALAEVRTLPTADFVVISTVFILVFHRPVFFKIHTPVGLIYDSHFSSHNPNHGRCVFYYWTLTFHLIPDSEIVLTPTPPGPGLCALSLLLLIQRHREWNCVVGSRSIGHRFLGKPLIGSETNLPYPSTSGR